MKQAGWKWAGFAALAAMSLGTMAPVSAQSGGLDFRLPPADDGRDSSVQGPSDNGLPPAPRVVRPPVPKAPDTRVTVPPAQPTLPTTTVPKASSPVPKSAPAAPKASAPAPKAAPATPKEVSPAPKAAVTEPAPAPVPAPPLVPAPVTPAEPLPVLPIDGNAAETEAFDDSVPVTESEAADDDAASVTAGDSAEASGGMPWWAWPLVMLIALCAGYAYWRRQIDGDEDEDEPVVPAPAAPVAARPAPIAPRTPPPASPRPVPAQPVVPPRGADTPPPQPVNRSPLPEQRGAERGRVVLPTEDQNDAAFALAAAVSVPAPSAVPAPRPAVPVTPRAPDLSSFVTAQPLVRRPADEMRADVTMDVAVRSIRIEADHVAVGFLLTLSNIGKLDAASLMVRIALGQGSAMNEAVLGRFYDGAGGSVLRDDIDLPAGRSEQLSSEVKLPRSTIDPLVMGGKPMMVPVLAADVTYHWDGTGDAFGQVAAAYVLGRAAVGGSEKLAPIPLDHVPLAVDRPGVRATAITRRQ